MQVKAPYLDYEKIRVIADNFLNEFHRERSIPVPIEEVIEFQLGIDIVPLEGLQQAFGVEGFTSNNRERINVDASVMTDNPNRYRFTLAHELGHIKMHKGLFDEAVYDSAPDYKNFIGNIPTNEYSYFETHANNYAGLVLVPTGVLERELDVSCELLEKEGYDLEENGINDLVYGFILRDLARKFEVSKQVIDIRIDKEGLFE